MTRHLKAAGLACALALLAGPALAQSRIQAGTLSCSVAPGVGFVVGSSKALACRFNPAGGGPVDLYSGRVNKVGVDIGATAGGQIVWAVLAPTADYRPSSLAGTYTGVGGEATVGAGLGANALVGGSGRSFALQPVSVSGQTGLNVAAGIVSITLEPGL